MNVDIFIDGRKVSGGFEYCYGAYLQDAGKNISNDTIWNDRPYNSAYAAEQAALKNYKKKFPNARVSIQHPAAGTMA